MSENLASYVSESRARAREAASREAIAAIKAKRGAEATLRKAGGAAVPFGDWSMDQFDLLQEKDPARFNALIESSPEFRDRCRLLKAEIEDALEGCREAEDRAAAVAALSPPADLALADRHARERQLYRQQNNVQDLATAPGLVKDGYAALLARQKAEIQSCPTK